MEDIVISLQNIADSLERIGDRLERIETKLNDKIVVQVDLDKYCLDGDPYIRVHGKIWAKS